MSFLIIDTIQRDYSIGIIKVEGQAFKDYPDVVKGYMLHYTYGDVLGGLGYDTFDLSFHSQHIVSGSLEELTEQMEKIKEKVLATEFEVDQFAYVNLFIIQDNGYWLVITSESFDIRKFL